MLLVHVHTNMSFKVKKSNKQSFESILSKCQADFQSRDLPIKSDWQSIIPFYVINMDLNLLLSDVSKYMYQKCYLND